MFSDVGEQTAASAVITDSVSDFCLCLRDETGEHAAIELHDPPILMLTSVYRRTHTYIYSSNAESRLPMVPHSVTRIKVCGGAHCLKISRFTCQLWSVVVNLICGTGSVRCVKKTKPKSSTYYMDLFIIRPTGDPGMSLLCTCANWEACVTHSCGFFPFISSILHWLPSQFLTQIHPSCS